MSYRLRLVIIISLLIAISLSVGGTILIAVSFRESLETETQAALESFETVGRTLYLMNTTGSQTGCDSLAETLGKMAEQGVGGWQSLSLSSGEGILYQNGMAPLERGDMPPAMGQCSYIRIRDDHGQGLLVMSTMEAGQEQLVLKARFDMSRVYALRERQQRVFAAVYVIVVLLGMVVSTVLSYALTRRLRQLAGAVRRISGGDLSTRSRIASQDEFGQLSRDFDAMADRLQETIDRLESDIERQETFMGAFAHELKTPMTSIIGFSDLLRQGNLDENTRMMAAEYIHSEGHRLENLSFKLLELLLLKKDTLVMRRVWLHGYVYEVERALTPGLKKKGIRLVCKAEQKRVAFEPDLVKSLLYNLIDNAAKAMDGEGIIALKANAIPGGCQFHVVDNGRGMEEKELSRITEAFYRVDKARSRSQGGAGLGLALCKQIVELHNGTMQYDSRVGTGTQVVVTLYGKGEKKQ